jgi:hypothetical protein
MPPSRAHFLFFLLLPMLNKLTHRYALFDELALLLFLLKEPVNGFIYIIVNIIYQLMQ